MKAELTLLTNDTVIVETNLTEEEKAIIRQGREEYKKGDFVPLELQDVATPDDIAAHNLAVEEYRRGETVSLDALGL